MQELTTFSQLLSLTYHKNIKIISKLAVTPAATGVHHYYLHHWNTVCPSAPRAQWILQSLISCWYYLEQDSGAFKMYF